MSIAEQKKNQGLEYRLPESGIKRRVWFTLIKSPDDVEELSWYIRRLAENCQEDGLMLEVWTARVKPQNRVERSAQS